MEENKVITPVRVSRTLISDNKVWTWYSCQLKENRKHLSILIHFCFFLFVFFSLFLTKRNKQWRPNFIGANRSGDIDQNPGSCHNLRQYLCTKGRHCTKNHLHCIRTPLIHSDLTLEDRLSRKKISFIPQEVCPSVRLRPFHVRLRTTNTKLVLINRDR